MSGLRPAVSEDLPRVREIVHAAYDPYIARMGRPPQPMLDDYAAQLAAGQLQVLEEAGRVVGVLVLIDKPDSLLLYNIAVDPALKGRGFGRQMLIAAEAAACARGYARMTLFTHATMTENQALYRRAGWREVERVNEAGFERVYFAKDLE